VLAAHGFAGRMASEEQQCAAPPAGRRWHRTPRCVPAGSSSVLTTRWEAQAVHAALRARWEMRVHHTAMCGPVHMHHAGLPGLRPAAQVNVACIAASTSCDFSPEKQHHIHVVD